MTAKDPSVRRGVQASSLTLSLLLAVGATSARAEEISEAKAEEGVALAATAATTAGGAPRGGRPLFHAAC